MRTSRLALLLSAASVLPASGGAAPAATQEPGTYVVECTFTNPAYSGECDVSEETAASVPPRRACEQILSCLNDVRCTSKMYCNATSVRGGWKLVKAERGSSARP